MNISNSQLKVLLVSKQYPPAIGGGGSHVSYLARELSQKEGVEVHVLTSTSKNKPKVWDHRDSKPPRSLIEHRVSFKHGDALHFETAIKEGLELCERIKPHVIHGQHMAGALIGLHLKASFNKPLLVTLHKTPIEWDHTKTQRSPMYSYMKLLSQLEIIDSFIACSEIFKQELINIGVKDTKIRFIYHGIPIKWYREKAHDKGRIANIRGKLKLNSDDKLIICPSRLDDERKDLSVFVNAAGLLSKEIKNKNFIFLITGTASTKNAEANRLKRELEDIASFHNIRDRLIFSSFKEDELPALNYIAGACVLPSRREGLGLVLLEALAVRTPIVGSNVCGIKEVIETNGIHGLLFTAGSSNDLAEQLKKLFTNEDLSKLLKREGLKRLKKIFDAEIMADKHLEVYRELINKKAKF